MKKLVAIVAFLLLAMAGVWLAARWLQGPAPTEGETVLRFDAVPIPFSHGGDLDASLPFMAVAAVDIDGDRVDEIFLGSGHGHADGLYAFNGAGFNRQDAPSTSLGKASDDATMGAASLDIDGDGREELFLARESGVYLYRNAGDGLFDGERLDFAMDPETVPLSVALGDIDNDGWVDLYISGYIQQTAIEGETNFSSDYGGFSYLLRNRGDNTWEDISRSAGVFRQHNTFVAIFVELNDDVWADLVVAQDTGVVETWQNNGDLTFTRRANPTVNSYPMGIGAGDIDNDGRVDLYFSNVGTTLPESMLRGNLAEDAPFNMQYMLLLNEGDFLFRDIAAERNAASFGFGWGTTIADFTADGRMDLYFSQNYARFPGSSVLPLYPGRLLEQQSDGTFLSVEAAAGAANRHFGVTQVVSDFNQDGRLDLVIANLTGEARALIARHNPRRGFSVRLPSTAKWLNARVRVTMEAGPTLIRQRIAGTGLGSDGTDAVHFGLGEAPGAVDVHIERLDGWTASFDNVDPSRTLVIDDDPAAKDSESAEESPR